MINANGGSFSNNNGITSNCNDNSNIINLIDATSTIIRKLPARKAHNKNKPHIDTNKPTKRCSQCLRKLPSCFYNKGQWDMTLLSMQK